MASSDHARISTRPPRSSYGRRIPAVFDRAALVRTRLATHRLVAPHFATPVDAVQSLLAVQAQDYGAGLWAIGQRSEARRADVEAALADRTLVRSWPMRGTLHVVRADDLRWLLALLASRVIKRAAGRNRQLSLDAKVFARARALFEKHLAGGKTLTRPELYTTLADAKIEPKDQRGPHILTQLAMEGVLCFGAHRGKQPTFALLDEWIPSSRQLAGDEALAELARRYFLGHGPATVDDLAWWSGLPIGEARRSLELVKAELESRVVDGVTYWSGALASTKRRGPIVHLLSAWDEYTVGYRDRSAAVAARHVTKSLNGLAWVVAVDGRIAGTWKRAIERDRVHISTDAFERIDPDALARAIERYQRFSTNPRSRPRGVGGL